MSVAPNPEISIVSPVYKSAESLPEFIQRVSESLSSITQNYEIILVNDGSPDNSWEIICQFAAKDTRIKGVALSRNFGQHPAVFCGLHKCRGDVVVILSCDLQEEPEYIPKLYYKHKEGYEVVYTLVDVKRFGLIRNILTKIYYRLYNYLVGQSFMSMGKTYSSMVLLSRKAVSNLLALKDVQFQYILLIKWLGFKSAHVEIKHKERKYGKSSYTLRKMVELAMVGIFFHSYKLLRVNVVIGLLISLLSFLGAALIVVNYFISGYAQGWASLSVLILFCIGSIFWTTGILGFYIEKIFDQVKSRPIYVIEEEVNVR